MRIRTQFMITMLLFGIILIVISVSAIITNQQVEKASKQERIASSIAQGASELSYLSNDYLIYRESHQLKRWQSRFTSFSNQVASLNLDKPEHQVLVRNIKTSQQRLKEVFDSTVSAVGSSSPNQSGELGLALFQVSWSRMAVQSQGLISDASRLSQLLHQEMDLLTETRTMLMYVMVGLFGIFLLASYMLTYRRILKSIVTLQAGTAVIGSGNLDFAITEKKNDEVGDLSRAFNKMTADLKAVTASKTDLEREVAERIRMEDALRQRTLELQQLTGTLEQRVQERTAELVKSNEMLQAEMAERLRLVAAVEQAGEGVVITDPEGAIHYVNPAFEWISGYRREELLGKNYYEVLTDEDLQKKAQNTPDQCGAWSGRITRRRRDGQSCELDVTFSPIRDQSGAVMNCLAVERDVTREARLEQHLRQMQKMEALGTLAGGIAHDFNNILNPIFINTELVLLDTPPGSSTRELMELSLKAAERGRELVKQIITFSRQKEKERKPTKAAPLIKEALKFLRASLPSTVEIRENISGETRYILADPTQIHQVVMNLCSNAAHAMREQGGVMEVGLAEVEVDAEMALRHPDLKPGPYMRLTVTDTGTGMTPEVMERAFDPFFTTKKSGEGSGMGLAVVHGIVRNHEGAITVYSELGKGSTFSGYLPKIEAGEKAETVATGPIPGGKERILLVDDEEIQIRTVQPALERLGYRVIARTDSGEALEAFRVRPDGLDLVITDQTMPQMTGLRLAEEILRIRPDIPIILCTGFSESVNGEKIKATGIREYIMKPFSARDLAETIRRALEGER